MGSSPWFGEVTAASGGVQAQNALYPRWTGGRLPENNLTDLAVQVDVTTVVIALVPFLPKTSTPRVRAAACAIGGFSRGNSQTLLEEFHSMA